MSTVIYTDIGFVPIKVNTFAIIINTLMSPHFIAQIRRGRIISKYI